MTVYRRYAAMCMAMDMARMAMPMLFPVRLPPACDSLCSA